MIKLDDNEHVVLEAQKHWFILFGEEIFLLGLILVPFFLYAGLQFLSAQHIVEISDGINHAMGALSAVWFLFIWVTFFVIWTNYYLNVLILTDKKVMDVDQKGLFNREISTCRLERIQDVTVEVKGFMATMLNFGTITIQTAGEEDNFVIRGIAHPAETKEAILRQSQSGSPHTGI